MCHFEKIQNTGFKKPFETLIFMEMTATDNRKTIVGRSTYRQNKQLLARNAH
jgi:hypothetical protein